MSTCSSPASNRSSYSSFSSSSSNPPSPQTAATTPGSCGALSPKFEEAFEAITHAPSPQPPSPSPFSHFSDSPAQSASPHRSSRQSTPLEVPYESPSAYCYSPSTYENSPGYAPPTMPRYSGYPPASAFYGPLPNSPESPGFLDFSPRYDDAPIDPMEYKMEDWYTADGRRVEYSAMAFHCATM